MEYCECSGLNLLIKTFPYDLVVFPFVLSSISDERYFVALSNPPGSLLLCCGYGRYFKLPHILLWKMKRNYNISLIILMR